MSNKSFKSKIAGVIHKNPDGSDRQVYIKNYCKPNSNLILKRELENPYDSHAISVWVKHKAWMRPAKEYQIGYLNRSVAKTVAEHVDPGGTAKVRITNITGGTKSKETRGVNIEITL
jgi:hypothetical protein